MKSILVTGAYGFLGRNVCLEFYKYGYNVVGIGHGKWSNDNYTDYGISKWIEADINFDNLKLLKQKFDVIVHCAGSSSVLKSLNDPITDFKNTVDTTLSVLEYIRLSDSVIKLIYPSSAALYGTKENKPISESEKLNPISPYGFHKKIAEDLCISYSRNFNVNVSIVRFFSLYGNGLKKQLIWDACNKFNNNSNVEFFGTGEETRDWLNIRDAVNLIFNLTQKDYKLKILNAGNGINTSINEVIKIISHNFNNKSFSFNKIERDGDPKFYTADISQAKSMGWSPEVLLEDGIKEYIDWFKKNND